MKSRSTRSAGLAGAVVLGVALAACAGPAALDSVAGDAASGSATTVGQLPSQATDLFGVSEPSGTQLTCPQPGPWKADQIASVCWYVSNQATVFTGPNTLGTATFSNDSSSNPYPAYPSTCTDNNAWQAAPSSFGKTMQAHFQCQYSDAKINHSRGSQSSPPWNASKSFPQARYVAPAPFASSEGITFSTQLKHGPAAQEDSRDQSNWRNASYWDYQPGCVNDASTQYISCNVTYTGDGGSVPNNNAAYMGFDLHTYPVIVQISNNLAQDSTGAGGVPDTVTLTAPPAVGGFLLDPAGGNPTSVKPGESGYFGLYKPIPASAGHNDLSTFVANYTLPKDSGDLPNTSVALNIEMDPHTGQLTGNSNCRVEANLSGSNDLQCGVQVLGLPLGVQKVLVELYSSATADGS